jgi:hypothetical protein
MLKKALLLVAASAVSVSAFAGGLDQAPVTTKNDTQMYVGAQAGYVSHYGFDTSSKQNSASVYTQRATFAKQQSSFGARVLAGYLFNENLGLELGAGTFGSQKAAMSTSVTSAKDLAYNIRTTALVGFDAGLMGQVSLTDELFAFGKAGMAYVDFKTKGYNADLDSTTNSVSNWIWMPRAEVGLGYNVAPNTAITVSYAHYFGINNPTAVKNGSATVKKDFSRFAPSFGLAAVGLSYSF